MHGFLQPLFDYACISWFFGTSKVFQGKLQTCQNRIIRFIHNLDSRTHLDAAHFSKLNSLDVTCRVNLLALNMMHKIYYETAPSYMCETSLVHNVHSHNTRRSKMTFVLPHVKSFGRKTFIYNAIKLWNNLPTETKMVLDKKVFKVKCKELFLNDMLSSSKSDFIAY